MRALLFLLLPALALAQGPSSPPIHRIALLADPKASPVVVSLARDQRLQLVVIVNAPAVESEVETLAVAAVNQQVGYWTHRPGPNVVLKAQSTSAPGKSAPMRTYYSGSGQSLREHFVEIDVEFLEPPEVRMQRLRNFLDETTPSQPRDRVDAATAYLDRLYIGNPPGTYDLRITYRPATGVFAGHALTRSLVVEVPNGPDTLDRLRHPPLRSPTH